MPLLEATVASLLTSFDFTSVQPTIDVDSIPHLYDHFPLRLSTFGAKRVNAADDLAPSVKHRQLTAMMCDLVGFTAIADEAHPEELAHALELHRRRSVTAR